MAKKRGGKKMVKVPASKAGARARRKAKAKGKEEY
jgi:hypothetical protein